MRPAIGCAAMMDALLCPSRGRKESLWSLYGLRCAREDAGCASPVATFLGPVGADRRGGARMGMVVGLKPVGLVVIWSWLGVGWYTGCSGLKPNALFIR